MSDPTCSKCHRHMEEGFVLDHTYEANMQAAWVEGQPLRSFWTVLKLPAGAPHPITTYRCTGCGYLESYARIGGQT